eukprot:317268_1
MSSKLLETLNQLIAIFSNTTDDELERYCQDMIDYDIFNSINSYSKASHDSYCFDMTNHDIYNLQFISSLIQNTPCYALFNLLHPYFNELLSKHTQSILENGFISNGINGKTLPLIDKECLIEMGIHNMTHQNIILNAINKIYFVFSQSSEFTYDILNKYLSIQLLESTRHKLEE